MRRIYTRERWMVLAVWRGWKTSPQRRALGRASRFTAQISPIALESTAEEALATPLSAIWALVEAIKKIPVAEAVKKTPLTKDTINLEQGETG